MEPQSGIKTWQWVVTVIVIIVLIIIGVLVFGNKGSQNLATETTIPTSTETPTGPINRVTMTDQYPGNVAFLSSVQADKPSWVVVQADNNGLPGKVIGSTHIDAGITPGVKITLTQPMVDGATYYAVIYTDDGSGKFDATTDKPVTDANGVIMHVFKSSTSVGAGLKG